MIKNYTETGIINVNGHRHRTAWLGNVVRYRAGTESKIGGGAAAALAWRGQLMAIAGSATDDDDTMMRIFHGSSQIRKHAEVAGISGLLQAGCMALTGSRK